MIALSIILNVLGILIYYTSKFVNRNVKDPFDFRFWFKSNWVKFFLTLLVNAVFMILLLHPETKVDNALKTIFPEGVVFVAKPTFSLLLGLGLALGIYDKVKKYTSKLK